VNDLVANEDRRTETLKCRFDNVNGAIDAGAKTTWTSKKDFHSAPIVPDRSPKIPPRPRFASMLSIAYLDGNKLVLAADASSIFGLCLIFRGNGLPRGIHRAERGLGELR
jgi:hypothetical protein